jgi:hypothetical protein
MAGNRTSGTRSLAPASGIVQTPNSSYITQNNSGTTLIVSSSTNVAGVLKVVGTGTNSYVVLQPNAHNVGNVTNPQGQDSISPIDQSLFSTTGQRKLAEAYFSGGVGIEKDLAVGGFIYGRIAAANTATTASNLTILKTNNDQTFYPLFTDSEGLIIQGAQLYGDDLNQDDSLGGLQYNPYEGKITSERFEATVSITPQADNTGTIGTEEVSWRDSYLNNIYTRFLGNTNSNITIAPAGGTGITDIFGDIRVRGNNPIGTAPVVTNTLYVTMDGDDTNDGRALDSSRACRTIGGAMKSPYYQPGTQILVSAGRYLEDNPLEMKPYTSVRGSDIRTTFIEPINKTQDLFHLNSGCYLNYMNFLNGRSGRLPGQYDPRFNRGAYATCFPPQTGDNRIDLFQSPYVQNCTNQSGPWLVDGTMFRPNQTVQVPQAVAMGSWEANTSTITVAVEQGTISIGQSVNSGKQNTGFFNARTLLLANKPFIQAQTIAWVNSNFPGFEYNQQLCYRDAGILVENMAYDMAFGGNQKSVESGLAYYRGVVSVIAGQETQTTGAIEYIKSLCRLIVENTSCPVLSVPVTIPAGSQVINTALVGGAITHDSIGNLFDIVINIINNGPSSAPEIYTSTGPDAAFVSAEILMQANRSFIQEQTINYINNNLIVPPGSFTYNQEKCYRDVGLIIDAVSQDILLGGNQKSLEAGLSYWNQGYNYVSQQLTTTTNAINYARDLALQVIANTTATVESGTTSSQIINTFFQYGGDYMPQEAVLRNFNIITSIINDGPIAAPPAYAGGGLFSLTGLNGSAVVIAPTVTSVTPVSGNTYTIGLSTSTIGFGQNATLYFGKTAVYPFQDWQVEEQSLEYTGSASSWNDRKVDPLGSIGGSLVDGGVISDRSPIQSFVYDAYTQLNQGGIGIKVTNNGYAQLVSVFTIFCNVGVQCDNGGIASITNSNCNFGDISLIAKGYGARRFSGTIYNPSFRAYPFSPNGPGLPYLDQFYPDGYWPNQGGRVEVFVPDTLNRPHIGLVMEIEPPEGHINEQGFAGFLNAQPSTSTLTTGTINLTNISTTDVYIGNSVLVRDQYGRQHDDNGVWYAATGTVVTDVNYNSISLNQALTSGGGDPTNPTYFTVYFCGNSYYTVQTSVVANQPYAPNTNILAANSDPNYQGPTTNQISAHISSLQHMKSVVDKVISNQVVGITSGNTATQYINTNITGGANAQTFIDNCFNTIINIVGAANITAANAVVPQSQITESGTVTAGAGSAITLIESNIDFIAQETAAYVDVNLLGGLGTYNKDKCVRDVKLILRQIVYDLQSGGNYNTVYSGLSYWSRTGSYHVVELGEAVTRPDLFPDGSIVNFYQRSYISASGYLFEYVGAGTNYGALPQRGVADPVQAKETVQLNAGKVFFTSTDQNGDFRIGPGLVISQATGVLSGRTFVQSLYANMTPFILAIE